MSKDDDEMERITRKIRERLESGKGLVADVIIVSPEFVQRAPTMFMFVLEYCKQRGWDIARLTIAQKREIMSTPDWVALSIPTNKNKGN